MHPAAAAATAAAAQLHLPTCNLTHMQFACDHVSRPPANPVLMPKIPNRKRRKGKGKRCERWLLPGPMSSQPPGDA
uniref:Putative secreted protein n=1 Tax=Anopheles marajoara TaxID=58244 RepID=A0A2M4CCM9_9DIPT